MQGTYRPHLIEKGCVPYEFLVEYAKGKEYLYANVIGRVERYDKPKELSEFGQKCDMAYVIRCRDCLIRKGWDGFCEVMGKPLTRPPQSWCYVESLGE